MIIRYIVFILAFLCFTNLQGQSTKKPNVVLIIIDDLNDFPEGFYGHPQAKTPHMKALEVLPIDGKEQAIDYFTKRLYSAGTYNNFYG